MVLLSRDVRESDSEQTGGLKATPIIVESLLSVSPSLEVQAHRKTRKASGKAVGEPHIPCIRSSSWHACVCNAGVGASLIDSLEHARCSRLDFSMLCAAVSGTLHWKSSFSPTPSFCAKQSRTADGWELGFPVVRETSLHHKSLACCSITLGCDLSDATVFSKSQHPNVAQDMKRE